MYTDDAEVPLYDVLEAMKKKENTPVPTPAEVSENYPTGVYEGGGYSAKGIFRPAENCLLPEYSH